MSQHDQAVKVSVIYYSSTGSVYEMARTIAESAEKEGAEVRLRKVSELAPPEAIASNAAWSSHAASTQHVAEAAAGDVVWADAVLFGSPTRFGNVASQLKQFFDALGGQWARGELADKVYSGFTSTSTSHGGHESTLLAMYNTFHHFGGIVVAPGYTDQVKFTDGNPYGTSHADHHGTVPVDDTARAAAAFQAQRVTRVAATLKSGALR